MFSLCHVSDPNTCPCRTDSEEDLFRRRDHFFDFLQCIENTKMGLDLDLDLTNQQQRVKGPGPPTPLLGFLHPGRISVEHQLF